MTALVIEDEPIVALSLRALLEEHGFAPVRAAATEEDAVRLGMASPLTLIVADYRLPNGNGLNAVIRILRQVAPPFPRVVFLTGNPRLVREGWEPFLWRIGAGSALRWSILTKPIDDSTLLQALQDPAPEGAPAPPRAGVTIPGLPQPKSFN